MRLLAVGLRRFITFYENKADLLVNVFSLVALVSLGEEYRRGDYSFASSKALGWYLVIQSARLFRIFFAINDVKIFEHMRPVLIRASFLYFAIVYFFAIFANSYFCGALDETDAQQTSSYNDANQWAAYAHILNFDTLLQSLFTMFQLSILGNWSMVMDAAVVSSSNPAGAYIFFYCYRLIVTLLVLPILVSFIIQVFLSATALREKEIELEVLAERQAHERRIANVQISRNPGRLSKISYNVNEEIVTMKSAAVAGGVAGAATSNEIRGSIVTLSPLAFHPRLQQQQLRHSTRVNKVPVGGARGSASYSTGTGGGNRVSLGGTAAADVDGDDDEDDEDDFDDTHSREEAARRRALLKLEPARVTVQYDVRGDSAVMSMWTLDGNSPARPSPQVVSAPSRTVSQGSSVSNSSISRTASATGTAATSAGAGAGAGTGDGTGTADSTTRARKKGSVMGKIAGVFSPAKVKETVRVISKEEELAAEVSLQSTVADSDII
jgi:hypothetical protein